MEIIIELFYNIDCQYALASNMRFIENTFNELSFHTIYVVVSCKDLLVYYLNILFFTWFDSVQTQQIAM